MSYLSHTRALTFDSAHLIIDFADFLHESQIPHTVDTFRYEMGKVWFTVKRLSEKSCWLCDKYSNVCTAAVYVYALSAGIREVRLLTLRRL